MRLIQGKLNQESSDRPFEDIPDRLADTLVIAPELTPGELAILHERGVAGIVTEHGGSHSHTAILAGSLGVPAVLGVRRAPGTQAPSMVRVADRPAREAPTQSKTVQASAAQVVTAVGGGAGAIAALDGTAQIVALGIFGVMALLAAWVMRERLRKWAEGDK